jgi:two-component system, OmpR family, KDP operon response regulator KdpE
MILLVEDNEMLVALLTRALEREGYAVVAAPTGVETMAVLHSGRFPDLIILDVGLPDVDGRDLLAALKKDPKTTGIPVVVWSGGGQQSERRIALELGAEDYVQKGSPSALVPKIERILFRLSEREIAQARKSVPAKKPD